MNARVNYDIDLLIKFCQENNVILNENYEEKKLTKDTIIYGVCKGCNNSFQKNFRAFINQGGPYCKSCVYINRTVKTTQSNIERYGVKNPMFLENVKNKLIQTNIERYGVNYAQMSEKIKEKIKQTNLSKYGVEHVFNVDEIKEKRRQTFIKNYGVDHPVKTEKIREKIKQTNLSKYGVEHALQNKELCNKAKITLYSNYGVEHPLQNDEIKAKMKQTNFEKFGVEYVFQNDVIKERIKQTNLEKFGVEHALQNVNIKKKKIQTCIEKYGVENPMQNPLIAENVMKSRFKLKEFIFPSGKIVKVQGYEHFCLKTLVESGIKDFDIIIGAKNVPEIWWESKDGKKHRYYTDIYIKSLNKCIEVKSKYTYKIEQEEVLLKQIATKNQGYNCEIHIYDNNGKCLEIIS
jgi:hypothetical protein